jgi:heat shock protein HslJ
MRALVMSFAIAMSITACETPAAVDESKLTEVDWVAETINGKPVIEPGRVTLSFSEARVSGRGGCNIYSGPVEYGNGTLKVGALISTKMACVANGVMQQESDYLNTLGAARSYAYQNDRLVISTPTGNALVFASAPRQQRPE